MPIDIVVDAGFLAMPAARGQPLCDMATEVQQAITREHRMWAPILVMYELGNVMRNRHVEIEPGQRWLTHHWLLSGVETVPLDDAGIKAVHEIADRYGLSFYDASYLHVATTRPGTLFLCLEGPLLTAAKAALGSERALSLVEAHARFCNKTSRGAT